MRRRASLRHRFAPAAIVALCVTLGVASAGCGGDLSAEDERDRMAEDLVAETDGALSEKQARCVADALHDAYGDESFEGVLDTAAGRSSDSSADDDEVRTQVIDIFAACDALEPIIDQG